MGLIFLLFAVISLTLTEAGAWQAAGAHAPGWVLLQFWGTSVLAFTVGLVIVWTFLAPARKGGGRDG
jgi:hypothetical protein